MRINVVGASGSGKSTLAKEISKKLNLPYIEMDRLFWGPNWHLPSDEVFFAKLEMRLKKDNWILDGNYSRSESIKWRNIDTVIWIDLPFYLNLYQAIFRATKRAISKEELWPGTNNRESFRKAFFSKESIVLWTIKTHKNFIGKYEYYMSAQEYSHINFIRLKSRKEINNFIKNLTLESLKEYN